VSPLAGSSFCGTHVMTGAEPRTTSGVTEPMPSARLPRGSTRPPDSSAASARLSHPDAVIPGFDMPLSSTSWPSKCERSR
jgi:hypothetical protein